MKGNVWSANRFEEGTQEERFVEDGCGVASRDGFNLRGSEVRKGAREVEEEGDGFHGAGFLEREDAESGEGSRKKTR